MGRLATRLINETSDFDVVSELTSSSELSDMLTADIAVDFTNPSASVRVVEYALSHGLRVLVGSSGWSAERIAALRLRVAETGGAVIVVPNFSLGSVLSTRFAELAATHFDSVEIVEAHRSSKVDSPSGTAVRTAERISAAREHLGPVAAPHSDQRARGQLVGGVPVHSLRQQGIVARQDVIFGGDGETLTITHNTLSPASYERGILLSLAALPAADGVTVGLDTLLGLGA